MRYQKPSWLKWLERIGVPPPEQRAPLTPTIQPVVLIDDLSRIAALEPRAMGYEEVDIAAGGAGLHTGARLLATETTVLLRTWSASVGGYTFRFLDSTQTGWTATWGAHTGRITRTSQCTAVVQAASDIPAAEVYPAVGNSCQLPSANYRNLVFTGAQPLIVLAPGWSVECVYETVNSNMTAMLIGWEEVPAPYHQNL